MFFKIAKKKKETVVELMTSGLKLSSFAFRTVAYGLIKLYQFTNNHPLILSILEKAEACLKESERFLVECTEGDHKDNSTSLQCLREMKIASKDISQLLSGWAHICINVVNTWTVLIFLWSQCSAVCCAARF